MSTPILPFNTHPSHYYPLPHLAPRFPAHQLPLTPSPPTRQTMSTAHLHPHPHMHPYAYPRMTSAHQPPYMGASKVLYPPSIIPFNPFLAAQWAPYGPGPLATPPTTPAPPPPPAPVPEPVFAPWVNIGIDPKLIYSPPEPVSALDDDSFASQPESMTFSPASGSDDDFSAPPTPDMSPIVSAGLVSQMPGEEFECVSPTIADEHRGGKRRRTSVSYVSAPAQAVVEEEDEVEDEAEDDESEEERVGRKRRRAAADDDFKPTRTARRAQRTPAPKKPAKSAAKKPAKSAAKKPAAARHTKPLPSRANPTATKKSSTTHAASTRPITVFACPYRPHSSPHLTCGAFFRTEADVRRHATKHLVKEFYAAQDGELAPEECFFGAREPTLLLCPNSWCGRPFARKDAYNRHIAEACRNITDRSAKAKQARLVAAREQAKCDDYWVPTPCPMPRSVEAVVGRVQGQQKPVILSIERVVDTYDECYDLKAARDGETEEVWWYREEGRGKIRIFETA